MTRAGGAGHATTAGGRESPDGPGGPGAHRVEASGRQRPRWLAPTTLTLVVLGLVTSAYLTLQHFTDNASLVCSVDGAFDCAKVTSSPWSTFMGVPVALLGLVFFAVLLVLCWPTVWRRGDALLDLVRIGWLTVGLGMALYLVWAELFKINALCLWCTVVHGTTFLLWIVVLFGQILSGPPSGRRAV